METPETTSLINEKNEELIQESPKEVHIIYDELPEDVSKHEEMVHESPKEVRTVTSVLPEEGGKHEEQVQESPKEILSVSPSVSPSVSDALPEEGGITLDMNISSKIEQVISDKSGPDLIPMIHDVLNIEAVAPLGDLPLNSLREPNTFDQLDFSDIDINIQLQTVLDLLSEFQTEEDKWKQKTQHFSINFEKKNQNSKNSPENIIFISESKTESTSLALLPKSIVEIEEEISPKIIIIKEKKNINDFIFNAGMTGLLAQVSKILPELKGEILQKRKRKETNDKGKESDVLFSYKNISSLSDN